MEDEYQITMSPLCRTITEDGHAFRVEIYRGEDSDWILEVVNPSDTSIVWDDQFPTDQAALDELLRTIRDEGVEALLDEPAGRDT